MQDEKSAAQAMAEITRRQEAALQFDRFGPEDAWVIGARLRERAALSGADVVIDITLSGLTLFHCAVGQPSPNNDRWAERKRNVVQEFFKSSRLVEQEMIISGRTLEEFGLSKVDFALPGGGFPIRIRGVGVVGAIVVSGLPQDMDHPWIVDAVAEYLHVETESVSK